MSDSFFTKFLSKNSVDAIFVLIRFSYFMFTFFVELYIQ